MIAEGPGSGAPVTYGYRDPLGYAYCAASWREPPRVLCVKHGRPIGTCETR